MTDSTGTRAPVAFVADAQIPSSPPPASEVGVRKWVRENLFPDFLNGALTVGAALFLLWLIPNVVQWALLHSVWNAGSLNECREIMDREFGEGVRGACWAVINERFGQFMFGFYPAELRWRPILAILLLPVALLPVLFSGVPLRRLWLLFTAAYPAIAYFLIWGGSVWPFFAFLLGLVVGVLVLLAVMRVPHPVIGTVGVGALAAVAAFFLYMTNVSGPLADGIARSVADWRISQVESAGGEDATTLQTQAAELDRLFEAQAAARASAAELGEQEVTLIREEGAAPETIALKSFRAALVSGDPALEEQLEKTAETIASEDDRAAFESYRAAVGEAGVLGDQISAQLAQIDPLTLDPIESRQIGGFTITIIIGVTAIAASLPIGVLLALGRQSSLFFIKGVCVTLIEAIRGVPLITLLFVASTLLNYFMPPGTNFDIILRVIILATLFSSAYIAEAIRGGLAALPKGQYEAGDAMGLTYWQSMRLIILPQALKISIPSIVNIFIGLFKDTTLVSIIGILDPVGLIVNIQGDSRWQGVYAEFYIFVAFFFFFLCFAMSRYSMYLERKLKTDHR